MELSGIIEALQKRYKERQKGAVPVRFLYENGCVFSVEYEEKSGLFYFYTGIAKIPDNQESKLGLYEQLLQGNLFHLNTGKGTLSIDKEADLVVYFVSAAKQGIITEQDLYKLTEEFTQYAVYWIQAIEKAAASHAKNKAQRKMQQADVKKTDIIMP